jgi:hypothetical protein
MKKTLGMTAVVVAALGFWAGVSAYQSASFMTAIQMGSAMLFGGNLLLCLWLWYRAEPGSGDAMVVPTLALLSASMLLGILPRLFWPTAERLHIAGSIVSVVVPAVVVIKQIRRRRKLGRGARSV